MLLVKCRRYNNIARTVDIPSYGIASYPDIYRGHATDIARRVNFYISASGNIINCDYESPRKKRAQNVLPKQTIFYVE